MDQERTNLQTTEESPTVVNNSATNDSFPDKIEEKIQSCFYTIFDITKEARTYTDLTGRFPNQSSRGNNYIFVAYNYDNNAILTKAIPNRETDTIITECKSIHVRL